MVYRPIGRLKFIPNKSSNDTYRSAWQFDLSEIGTDATINNAKLIITAYDYFSSAAEYKLRINAFPNSVDESNPQDLWNTIGGGSVYFDNIKYINASLLELSSTTLKNAVQSALSTGWIAFGVQSQFESANKSQSNIDLSLEVTYTPRVHITVINSFGHGTVTVDGSPYDSGDQFPWEKGSTHTLTSFDQIYDGVQYVTLNKWTNVNTGEVHNQNPLTLPFNDDNITWRAEFKAQLQITIKNEFGGGTIKVDGNEVNSPANYEWKYGSQHTIEAIDQDYQEPGQSNYYRIFKQWIKPDANTEFANPWSNNFTLEGTYTADFNKRFDINVTNSGLEGGSGGNINVNSQTVTSPHLEYTLEGNNIVVVAVANQDLEINSNTIEHNFLNYSDRDVINWGNQIPFPELSCTYTPTDHQDIDLLFKAHLHTSTSSLSDTKNQRRLLTLGNSWIMVYESAGDIWLTASADAGATWCKEERLNIRQRHGFNPSLSNEFSFGASDYDRYMIAWIEENESEEMEVHLQTMRINGGIFYGWLGGDYYGRVDGVNHRFFDWTGYGDPRTDARPVLNLFQSGNDIIMNLASEISGSGIALSRLKFTGNGYNSFDDLDDAIALKDGFNPGPPAGNIGFTRQVTTSTSHKYTVLLNVPASYGGPPYLRSVYRGYDSPTIMVEPSGSFKYPGYDFQCTIAETRAC